MNDTPDIKKIETLLSQVKAKPSAELEKKLADAPWNTPDETNDIAKSTMFVLPKRKRRSFGRVWQSVAVFMAIFMGVMIFVSPVRTFAQQLFGQFFITDVSNTHTDTVVLPTATPTIPSEALQATITARQASIPIMSDLRRMADFEFVVPQYIPTNYQLEDAYTRPNLVVLVYEPRGANPLARHITLQMSYGEPHGETAG